MPLPSSTAVHTKTKIVATLGPASSDEGMIGRLARAGCDVFRLNFSHGSHEDHGKRLAAIRSVEQQLGRPLAVLADLCGPKIRVGTMAGGKAQLVDGQMLTIQREPIEGTAERVSTSLIELIDAARVGDAILMDDGKIRLEVAATHAPHDIVCRVIAGGTLSSGKGINLPHTLLTLPSLTEKDRADFAWIARHDVDYIALSFVRTAADVQALRDLLTAANCPAQIIAKIEKPQALEHIVEIIQAADGIMVARGDLGVEMDLPAVPLAQKRLTRLCHEMGKPCIVATQMLESMTACPTPTRAEVCDVANAVLDLTDAVMLSGETAVGAYPEAAVAMMDRIVREMQGAHDAATLGPVAAGAAPLFAGLARAAREVIAADSIAAVVVYDADGSAARMLSKNRLQRPIVAISSDVRRVRQMALYYGVVPCLAAIPPQLPDMVRCASGQLATLQMARPGERVLILAGSNGGAQPNMLMVHELSSLGLRP